MMRTLCAALAALWLAGACAGARAGDYIAWATTRFPVPDHYRLINDYGNVLRAAQRVVLESRMQDLERRNGTQIVFLSVPNMGNDKEQYAKEVLTKWNIGNNRQQNGILVLVAPDYAMIHAMDRIAGAVPDVTVKRLYRDVLLPAAEQNELADGVEATLDKLIRASMDEDSFGTAYDYSKQRVDLYADEPGREHALIIALSLGGAGYAAALLWRRYIRRQEAV